MEKFQSRNAAETLKIAAKFAASLNPGDIVAFTGGLGVGKTIFTKGVARFFGISEDEVSSPTFTMVNEYDGDVTIYHFDAYRLENVDKSDCDWLDDYFFGDGICLIEWSENIRSVLPENCIQVKICKDLDFGEDYREITILR